jgi:hypothetical protein
MNSVAAIDSSLVDDEQQIDDQTKRIQAKQSPLHAYDYLSPLLDRRRIQHVIPEGVFRFHAAFDRIYIYQIAEWDQAAGAKFGDTSLFMPQQTREYRERETPRGIIVSAGLQAQEVLRSNGMAVGHIIRFIRNAPWRMIADNINGKEYGVFIMRDGDITGSEDLAANLKAGKVKLLEEGGRFCYVDEDGRQWDPKEPWIPDDM